MSGLYGASYSLQKNKKLILVQERCALVGHYTQQWKTIYGLAECCWGNLVSYTLQIEIKVFLSVKSCQQKFQAPKAVNTYLQQVTEHYPYSKIHFRSIQIAIPKCKAPIFFWVFWNLLVTSASPSYMLITMMAALVAIGMSRRQEGKTPSGSACEGMCKYLYCRCLHFISVSSFFFLIDFLQV